MTKTDILKIIEDERILGVSEYTNEIPENELLLSVDQVNAGYGTVQNPGLKNASQGGYDGDGVTIGIIEAASGRFDPDAPQLSDMVSSGQLEFIEVEGVNETITDHATHVTNIIAGQSYAFSGNTYEGIATGARVYQSGIAYESDVYTAFNQFIDLGVDVVNCSLGSSSSSYTSFDQEIDNLIYTSKVLFVKSAGNSYGTVTSPGKAYNAITVGNSETKSNSTTAESILYDIASSSSYQVNSYLSNKPELALYKQHF
ncbi:MAG: S8 family serine peptidase [Candidatus Delongbacteria bacterium]|nr:S8 family serine peptidase [Candidatus Delongbacteria bacterium]